MKTKFALNKSLSGYLRWGVAAAAALVSAALPFQSRAAAFDSPAGTWDITMSGTRQGLALMEFFDGGTPDTRTFTILEIVVPNRPASVSSSDTESRNPDGGDDSRNGPTGGGIPTPPVPMTNIFGLESADNGSWGFDGRGRVIGFHAEVLPPIITTNTVTLTNCLPDGIIYFPDQPCGFSSNVITYMTNFPGSNGVSFVGTVVPGKHLTLAVRIGSQKLVYQGLPAIVLPDLSGSWFGHRFATRETTVELFTLNPTGTPNVYDVTGGGGNYSYSGLGGEGIALVSRWNKIAFALPFDPDGLDGRATIGSFSSPVKNFNGLRLGFSTQGWEQRAGALDNHIRFTGGFSAPAD
jgi:hypothetical protein